MSQWVYPAEISIHDEVLCPAGECNEWVRVEQIGSGNGELLIACDDHDLVHLPANVRVEVRHAVPVSVIADALDESGLTEDVEARMPEWYAGDIEAAREARRTHDDAVAAGSAEHPHTSIEIEEHLHGWYGGDLAAVQR